jgi:hypothetical protein
MGLGVKRHTAAAKLPGKRPRTHYTGDWLGPRASLDKCGKSAPTGIWPPIRPARSESQYGLSYSRPHSSHIYIYIYIYACNETNLMHYLPSVYSVTIPLHVSGSLVAHHQEVTMYICNKWYVLYVSADCQLASWQSTKTKRQQYNSKHIFRENKCKRLLAANYSTNEPVKRKHADCSLLIGTLVPELKLKRNHLLRVIFWVVPRRVVFNSRRFGTLCLFHINRRFTSYPLAYEYGTDTVFRNVGY